MTTMTTTEAVWPGLRSLKSGGCSAWPLPADDTIAATARHHTSQELQSLGLPAPYTDDVVVMVSELATNALQHATPRSCSGGLSPSPHGPELWIYHRDSEQGRSELVIKVFDTNREEHPSPKSSTRDLLAERGHGLDIIDALTEGRWGHHPTRSRLRRPAVTGKATWFTLPTPRAALPARPPARQGAEAQAAADLHALLTERGIGGIIQQNDSTISLLSVRSDLTIWCRAGAFHWRTPAGHTVRLALADITEACEQIICEFLAGAVTADVYRFW